MSTNGSSYNNSIKLISMGKQHTHTHTRWAGMGRRVTPEPSPGSRVVRAGAGAGAGAVAVAALTNCVNSIFICVQFICCCWERLVARQFSEPFAAFKLNKRANNKKSTSTQSHKCACVCASVCVRVSTSVKTVPMSLTSNIPKGSAIQFVKVHCRQNLFAFFASI